MEPIDVMTFGKKRLEEDSSSDMDIDFITHCKKPVFDVKITVSSACSLSDSLFGAIPNEILVIILSFISDDLTFSRVVQVNKQWNMEGEFAWYKFCQTRNILQDEAFWCTIGKDWKWILQSKVHSFKVGQIQNGVGYAVIKDSLYQGEFVTGKRHGLGIETQHDSTYKGQWKEDEKSGKGIIFTSSGAKYEGSWANNKKNGQGCYTFPNGDRYEGEWKDDMKHGSGVYTFGKGKWEGDRYEGEWKANKKSGQGLYQWKDGDMYKGEFEDDNFNGFGVYNFSCGDRYEGEWRCDKRSGNGVYTYHHGGRFEGTFKDGKRTGLGVFTWKDGERYHGFWHFGSRRGRGTLYLLDGSTLDQEWNEPLDANYSVRAPLKYPQA